MTRQKTQRLSRTYIYPRPLSSLRPHRSRRRRADVPDPAGMTLLASQPPALADSNAPADRFARAQALPRSSLTALDDCFLGRVSAEAGDDGADERVACARGGDDLLGAELRWRVEGEVKGGGRAGVCHRRGGRLSSGGRGVGGDASERDDATGSELDKLGREERRELDEGLDH